MDNNMKQISEMENIVNKYIESMKIKDLISSEFIKKYLNNSDVLNNFAISSYSEKSLTQLNENDIRSLDELIARQTSFKNFIELIERAKQFLVAEKLKELNLL